MAPPDFDHSRSDASRYNNLQTPLDAVRLQKYIYDFVAWFKTCPEPSSPEELAKWETSVESFLSILNDTRAWDIAQPVVPEFRETKTYKSGNSNVDMLLERVRPRLRDPPYNHPLDLGERLDWENQKALIEYMGYGGGYWDGAPLRQAQKELKRSTR